MQEVPGPTTSSTVPVAGLVRSARAVADLSQRALARRAGLSKGAVARMEQDWTGQATTVKALAQALRACGLTIDVTRDGRRIAPDADLVVDRGGRLLPPHLDPHPIWHWRDWWGLRTLRGWDPRIDGYTPERAYCRSREWREARRSHESVPWDAIRWEDSRHLASSAVTDAVAFRIAYGRRGRDSARPSYLEGPEPEHGHAHGRHLFYPWPRGGRHQDSGR